MSEKMYHHYSFLKPLSSYTLLTQDEKTLLCAEFEKLLEKTPEFVSTYSVFALQREARVMLWMNASSLENIQSALHGLLSSRLGLHLEIADVYYGLSKSSTYSTASRKEREISADGKRKKYFVVYPFTKTAEWYLLDFAKRRALMAEHVNVGLKHGGINQLLLYGIGMNNHEFIVSYEMDSLPAFQDLVTELRSTEGRRYTLNDLPVLTCIQKPIHETLLFL